MATTSAPKRINSGSEDEKEDAQSNAHGCRSVFSTIIQVRHNNYKTTLKTIETELAGSLEALDILLLHNYLQNIYLEKNGLMHKQKGDATTLRTRDLNKVLTMEGFAKDPEAICIKINPFSSNPKNIQRAKKAMVAAFSRGGRYELESLTNAEVHQQFSFYHADRYLQFNR